MANRKKTRLTRLIISSVLFIGIISSSVIIVFADDDIPSLLTNWFYSKTESMMGEISEEIENEKDKQISRLEKELTAMIIVAENDLITFTENEKQKRVEQLRAYGDQLIQEFEVDHTDDMDEISNELEAILEKAIDDMNTLIKERFTEKNIDE